MGLPRRSGLAQERVSGALDLFDAVGSEKVVEPAHVAQLVEHFLGKEEVSGSNPLVGSRQFRRDRLNSR